MHDLLGYATARLVWGTYLLTCAIPVLWTMFYPEHLYQYSTVSWSFVRNENHGQSDANLHFGQTLRGSSRFEPRGAYTRSARKLEL